MLANMIQRPALGQRVTIGTLYSITSETFSDRSLLQSELPADATTKTEIQRSKVLVSSADGYEENFSTLGIDTELGASTLAGLVELSGCGLYLLEDRPGSNFHATIHQRRTTADEKLCFTCAGLRDALALDQIKRSEASHMVTGIEWAAKVS